jgi:enediyne biosynthesis protein E4
MLLTETDLVLTSLTSKRWPSLLGGPLIILSACSTQSKIGPDLPNLNLDNELSSLSEKEKVADYSPTSKTGTLFVDKTRDYGLDGIGAVALNAVDLNFDGRSDLVVLPNYYSRPKFFIFDNEKKRFSLWEHDPLPLDFKASFLLFYDINKDKVIDLIAGVLNQRSEVSKIPIKYFKGVIKQGRIFFEEIPDAIKLAASPTSSLTLLDFDLDGELDLFVGNWFSTRAGEHIPVADRLLRNNQGKFEDVSHKLKAELDQGPDQLFPPLARPTYGSSSCDIDQNGYPDILTSSSSGYQNKLWMNLRQSTTAERYFDDVGPISNYASDPQGSLLPTGGGRTFFSACADYNDDGLMDIFMGELSHAYDNESVDRSSILTSSKETYPPFFLRTEYLSDATSESWNQGDRRGVWVDYNLDGRIDLLVDNSGFPPHSRLVLFEQDKTRAFENVAALVGIDIVNPSATIVMDVNQDGVPDVLTAQNNIRLSSITPRLYLFENQLKLSGKRSIKIHLDGNKSNTSALGAMVMLYLKIEGRPVVQRRWVEYSQGGLSSQNESGIIFGVEAKHEVLGVKVRWPYQERSGQKSGVVGEKLYSLRAYASSSLIEVTLCEDGVILRGKMSCTAR